MVNNESKLFSILIPTWNNLDFLKLCIESIRKNSCFQHQIIVYVNDGSDGTLDWVRSMEGLDFVHSPNNVGICLALNALRPLVKTDYVLYMNDDMYVCPQWDKYLWKEIEKLTDNKFFLSSTLIQPRTGSKSMIAPPIMARALRLLTRNGCWRNMPLCHMRTGWVPRGLPT